MAKPGDGSGFGRFTFSMGDTGELEWTYLQSAPDMTAEQAAVVAQARGMRDIARGLEAIADAIAEHTRIIAKVHGIEQD